MAKDSPQQDSPRPIRRLLTRLIKAPAVLAILWPALLLCVGYWAWHQWGAEHLARRYFGVREEQITVSEPPESIRSKVADLVTDVYEDTAMDQLSLLDAGASSKIASAFAIHPWVRQVISVRKLPGGAVDVRLAYRRPAAMIYSAGENGFFAVDGDAVLLPDKHFSPSDTERYCHIFVPQFKPSRNQLIPGQAFGDPRIRAAAKLADYLNIAKSVSDAGDVQVRAIQVVGDPRQNPEPQLEVLQGTRQQLAAHYRGDSNALQRVFWGSAPGSEMPGEVAASIKLQRLIAGVAPGANLSMATQPH
ncbi:MULTISPECIES: hypothetical protein [Crateriforma]|uniref:Cell division protein FtsQ n=1 Tax=Crateriforma conspicua TaxID=2527996 RepID=A0A5C6FYE7_9PLAN|nr:MULTISPECIES: hypothetical protein [Crateriforma]TWU66330.1 hypothetical protein V7x_18940 [Crateriforma conspicua]